MQPHPPSLAAATQVELAARRLIAERLDGMPVVEADGRFAGMFTLRQVLGSVLPHAVKLGSGLVGDLSFMHESLQSMRADLAAIARKPVGNQLDRNVPTVGPDTEVIKLLQLFWAGHDVLPVVEADTHKLVGIVTGRDILAKLLDGNNAR